MLENLWDEEHGEANHAELWLRFAEGIGAGREATREAEWNDAPAELRLAEEIAGEIPDVQLGSLVVFSPLT